MRQKMDNDIEKKRSYTIHKRNDFVRQAKYSLSAQQLKVLSFIFSKISANDTELKTYTITVREYCDLCGIDNDNGGNYAYIKRTLKALSDESFWIYDEEKNADVLVRWVNEPEIYKTDGTIKVRLSPYIQQFVIGIARDFTDYPFLMVLPMRSSHAIRIYELLKSVQYQGECTYDIDELKHTLFGRDKRDRWIEKYPNFKDFRMRVLEPAEKEINRYTDLTVAWEAIYRGNRVQQVRFRIQTKPPRQLMTAMQEGEEKINRRARKPVKSA